MRRNSCFSHLLYEGNEISHPFQGFTPGFQKGLKGSLNIGQTIGEKNSASPVHFSKGGEIRQLLEGLQGAEYARQVGCGEEIRRVL